MQLERFFLTYFMKKFFLSLSIFLTGLAISSCTNDLWDKYNDLCSRVESLEAASIQANKDIAALKTIVGNINQRLYVTEVVETEEACTFRFSNGEYVTISKGNDAPVISIKKDVDGIYYWTFDGNWIYDDERHKLKVEGKDGVSPIVMINPDTKIWEISDNSGKNWYSTGITASETDSIFKGINLDHEDYVELELADGTKLNIPRYNEKVDFAIDKAQNTIQVKYGQIKTFAIRACEISDFFLLKTPAGWGIDMTKKELRITAPEKSTAAEMERDIIISALTKSRYSITIRQKVKAVEDEIRVLTFENEDYVGDANIFGYKNWSSLVSKKQNPDPCWYDWNCGYRWRDGNNTNLSNVSMLAIGRWSGGVGLSNHVKLDKIDKNETNTLTIPYQDSEGNNFAVAAGYAYPGEEHTKRPYISFADSVERVIAIGYDVEGNQGTSVEFALCSGKKAVREWTKWDLSSLGRVFRVEFSFVASEKMSENDGEGGLALALPSYFAFDNVAVRFE